MCRIRPFAEDRSIYVNPCSSVNVRIVVLGTEVIITGSELKDGIVTNCFDLFGLSAKVYGGSFGVRRKSGWYWDMCTDSLTGHLRNYGIEAIECCKLTHSRT